MEDASALVFAAELMASSTVPATANLQIFDGTLFLSPSTPTLDSSGVAEAEVVVGAAVAHPFELGTGKLDFGPRAAPLARVAPIAPPRKSAAHVVNGFSPSSQTDCLCPPPFSLPIPLAQLPLDHWKPRPLHDESSCPAGG